MKKENNLKQNVIPHLRGNPVENKELDTTGYSGRAIACPRMTESGHFTFPRHPEFSSGSTLCGNGEYGFRNKFGMTDCGESGRSMVEMLGVLAIIGVLSVGGITGYTSAMRQYRANEIVNATSMLYMMGSSQNQGAGDKQMLYSAALGTVPSGATEITYNADKTITIAITDEDICTQVKNKLGNKAGECTAAASGYILTVTFGEAIATQGFEPCGECSGEACTDVKSKKCAFDPIGNDYVVVECDEEPIFGGVVWKLVTPEVYYQDNKCTQMKS